MNSRKKLCGVQLSNQLSCVKIKLLQIMIYVQILQNAKKGVDKKYNIFTSKWPEVFFF